MKTLVIAEKPSVARDIARVLGCSKKENGALEGNKYIVTWALGHLVTLKDPEDYDKKYKEWNMAVLPMMPEKLQIKVIPQTGKQYHAVTTQLARKDVNEIVIATDAGREGELVARWILDKAHNQKPCKRLWISSVTDKAIREGFANLKDAKEYDNLYRAAVSRAEADWLVGINATRALTCKYNAQLSCGRVQTPTLAMIVDREREIQNFKPYPYWRIIGKFAIENGEYEGVYQRPDYKASDKNPNDKPDRIWKHEDAERILNDVRSIQTAKISEKKTVAKQSAPRLYDLTSLQREANNKYSLPAGRTLSIAQSLYEKHKMITYPRTDSRALPEDYRGVVLNTLAALDSPYAEFAKRAIDEGYVKKAGKRIFDNKQVSDHFALIPTDMPAKKLTDDERRIYDMIVRRFIAAFYPEAQFDVTVRMSAVGSHVFRTEGKILRVAGWLNVYNKEASDDEILPALAHDKESGKLVEAKLKEEKTKTPPRYTEA